MPSFLHRDTNQYFPATGLFEYNGSKCRIMETNKFYKYYFRMKMFYPHEMDILLDNSGLVIKNKMGDYEGSPMNEKSGMQIYVCGRV